MAVIGKWGEVYFKKTLRERVMEGKGRERERWKEKGEGEIKGRERWKEKEEGKKWKEKRERKRN